MKYEARQYLGVLNGAIQNVLNIQSGIRSMVMCRVNSECAHMDHHSEMCPLYKKIHEETCEIARPMFNYAKEMLSKALERFQVTHDAIMQTLPPDLSDEEVWSHSIRMIEGGNSFYNVEESIGLAVNALKSEL